MIESISKSNREKLLEIFKKSGYESIRCWIPPEHCISQEQAELELLTVLQNLSENKNITLCNEVL